MRQLKLSKPSARTWRVVACVFGALIANAVAATHTAQSAAAQPPPSGAQPRSQGASAQTAAPQTVAAPMTAEEVIQVLNQTVDWYRTLGIQQQAANEPSDLLILYDNRQTATQAVRLAFEIARASAEALANHSSAASGAGGASVAASPLNELQKKQDALAQNVQSELDSARHALSGARRQQKSDLQAKISDLQGELDLISARKNLLNTLSEFAGTSGSGGSGASGLKAQIDAMAIALPSANIATASSTSASSNSTSSSAGSPAAAPSSSPAASSAPIPALSANSGGLPTQFGMWDLAENVFKLSEKAHTIETVDRQTAALQSTFLQIRTPLIDRLKTLSARGDALAAQADAPNSAAQSDVRSQLDSLAAQFKATAALLIPLSKEGLLLTQYRRNLDTWRDAVKNQYRDALKRLGVRLGALLVLLAIVFAAAELWKRAVLRYIQDSRRRYQFLLLRRIALWALVVVIIGFAFASELGSIVTFAGLITAGVAVAMQSVLVSIVGYFFLIGKYGIRIGDRVQIGEVKGEVIELGLVRLYLMELGGHGQTGPTGRVVAYANSIVFQVSTGLFKQIAGVNIAWHEITLNLPAGCDYAATKDKLLAAATDVLKDYRDEIVRQTKEIQRTTMSDSGGDAQPKVQLNFASSGVQAIVRYPVHLQHSAEIDERMSRELLNAIPSTTA